MQNKTITVYSCSNCGAQTPKWSGRCLECGKWDTLQIKTVNEKERSVQAVHADMGDVVDLGSLRLKNQSRIITGIEEADRVLGGGLVPGSLVLLSGEPGIGKSTIVAQIADAVQKTSQVAYVSGEESAYQVKTRLDRLNIKCENIKFISDTHLEKILAVIEMIKPDLVIIDSIQSIYSAALPSEAGSVSQIRISATKCMELAKSQDIAFIIIGHITKDGAVAGPKSLEHLVDTVIYLESEVGSDLRILRSTKNRFGSVNELGVFRMTEAGFAEIKNPSKIFLDVSQSSLPGSAISCLMEGSRPFMVEVQALVSKTFFGYPQRKASGYDLNRLQILITVLQKRAKVNLTNQDVFLNVVGGFKVNDASLDLAVCLAIASSLLNLEIGRDIIILGEVGLGGEIRKIKNLEKRILEGEKLGFKKALIPNMEVKPGKIQLSKIISLTDGIKFITQ